MVVNIINQLFIIIYSAPHFPKQKAKRFINIIQVVILSLLFF
jgi:hypothetical protein